jgi:hypothetical protein
MHGGGSHSPEAHNLHHPDFMSGKVYVVSATPSQCMTRGGCLYWSQVYSTSRVGAFDAETGARLGKEAGEQLKKEAGPEFFVW